MVGGRTFTEIALERLKREAATLAAHVEAMREALADLPEEGE
jgi:hypothetical protein